LIFKIGPLAFHKADIDKWWPIIKAAMSASGHD
jgi:hypothetical protein